MIALGFDTSCYTTSVALADPAGRYDAERRLLPVAAGECGLRQSEAVFAHVRQLPELLETLLLRAGEKVGAVCASTAPRDADDSYMPVFMVGAGFARAVAAALSVPFFTTTHQRGHLRAAKADTGLSSDHYLALHLSGGTTDVLLVRGESIEPLGCSLDLHAGQLVDRVGVKLGLPFPAGPSLEKLAEGFDARSVVPVSMDDERLCCHLSGAEAQLMRMIEKGNDVPGQIAAETYDIIARSVLRLLSAAGEKTGEKNVLLAGGVISSARLRGLLKARCLKRRLPLSLFFGRPELSGDNAVGVALLGAERMG